MNSKLARTIITILTIILLVSLGLSAWYIVTKNNESAVIKADNQKLREEIKKDREDQAQRDKENLVLKAKLESEKNERIKSDAAILDLQKQMAVIQAEADKYREQIPQMTDAKLMADIGNKIGAENIGMALGDKYRFSLTRPGGEKTAAVFSERDEYFSLVIKKDAEIKEAQGKVKSLDNSLVTLQKITDNEHAGRISAEANVSDLLDRLSKTEKGMTGGKIKAFGWGALGGAAVASILFSLIK